MTSYPAALLIYCPESHNHITTITDAFDLHTLSLHTCLILNHVLSVSTDLTITTITSISSHQSHHITSPSSQTRLIKNTKSCY